MADLESQVRQYIYRHFIRQGTAPAVGSIAAELHVSVQRAQTVLQRLCASHAFMLQQEGGELWRAAPFSAVPTAFPVRVSRKLYYGNCIWDALGIPAMLKKDARILAACGCCNLEMPLHVAKGKLRKAEGVIHFAVPARNWYQDVVFT